VVATERAGIVLAGLMVLLLPLAAAAEPRGLIEFGGRHVKWGAPDYGSGAEITYAFLHRARSFPGARNCSDMLPIASLTKRAAIPGPVLRATVAEAAAMWSSVAPLTFREVASTDAADILIGAQNGRRGVAFTNVSPDDRTGSVARLTQAAICLDPTERWSAGWDGDATTYDLPRVMAHELGHAIGLDHQGRDGGIMGYAYIEQPAIVPSPADVAAVTRLYGWGGMSTASLTHDTAARPPSSIPAGGCAAVDGDVVECGLATRGGTTQAAVRRER
jgi:hypothetical protein